MTMRRVLTGFSDRRKPEERAAELLRSLFAGFDDHHIEYLADRHINPADLVPGPLEGHMTAWLLSYLSLRNLRDEEWVQAMVAVRPGCARLLSTPGGRDWFLSIVPRRDET